MRERKWMTFETFQEIYNLPARMFLERCDLEKGLIDVTYISTIKRNPYKERKNDKYNIQ